MKRYFKKSEILREMGKNPKDIRLLDRMIARGEIIEEGGKWRFTNEVEEESGQKVDIDIDAIVDKKLSLLVQEYKDRIKELEEELKKKSVAVATVATPSSNDSDLIDHIRLLYQFNEAKQNAIDELVQLYYNKNTSGGWDNAVEKVYGMIKYSENPLEKDELEYVKSLIS